MSNKQLVMIAFDLDGTLTQHKTSLEEKNGAILDSLSKSYRLVMLAAGTCERVYNQLGAFAVDIIGNYGMQESTVIDRGPDQKLHVIRDDKVPVDRQKITERITKIRQQTGYTTYSGETVEFHPSGVITFPLLGTKAKSNEKLNFDPDRKKRRQIYQLVVNQFPEYNVFIGGSSSFDFAPKPNDKYQALIRYATKYGITQDTILYVGDDFGPGGNDEPVLKGGVQCLNVTDYRKLPELIKPYLVEV